MLVEAGAEAVHALEGQPALHLALSYGCLAGAAPAACAACVKLLIAAEVVVAGSVDDALRTPLHVAAGYGLEQALSVLLEAGAGEDANAKDATGGTPLHAAARGGHAACVEALLGAGSDAALQDVDGATPLHAAAGAGADACVAALLASPGGAAAAAAKDTRGRTPAVVAALRGHAAAAALLGAAPDDVAAPVSVGTTLILAPPACSEHHTAPLLARGAPDPPPENERRLDALLNPTAGALRASEFVPSGRVTLDEEVECAAELGDVLRCHEWAYVRSLQNAIRGVPDAPGVVGSLDGDTAVAAGSWRAALSAAGAVTAAVDAVVRGTARNAFCAVRPPGHHAGPWGPVTEGEPPGSGSHGFCLLNNVAIGAAYAMSVHRGAIRRVAIVDFDVHHGNGTEACVEAAVPGMAKLPFTTVAAAGVLRVPSCKPWRGESDGDDIFFASVHGFDRGFYPGTGATVDTRGGVPAAEAHEWAQEAVAPAALGAREAHPRGAPRVVDVGTAGTGPRLRRGAAWRRVWAGRVLPALHAFAPDLLLISAGFDAHIKDDIQGPVNLGVTESDYEWLTGQLVAIANTHAAGRVVSVLEGGYRVHAGVASAFGRSVAAHVRALAAPSAERFDAVAEAAALRDFWAKRAQEQREAAEAAAAAAAAAAADGGEGVVVALLADAMDEDGGARRKRPRAAVDYAALAEKLAAEEAAAATAAAAAASAE
jgi:acetoin utilization deacetylase AcuC-like enzyme/ankyrin repeat protein